MIRRLPWLSIASVAGFLSIWEILDRVGVIDPVLMSSPSRIASAATVLIGGGVLNDDLLFTVKVLALSLLCAVVLGTLIGYAVGRSQRAYQVLNPFIVVANSLPKIVLMPLVVLWFGIGLRANVFLSFLMASFPILVATYTGVRSLERDYIVLARSFGASRYFQTRTIVLPGLVPYILSGLRVAISYAMVGALIAEFFASSQGIGYRMTVFMANFQVDYFFVCMAVVACITLVLTGIVNRLEKRLQAWRPSAFSAMEGLR